VRYLPYGQERWNNGTAVTDFGFTSQRNERGFGLMDYNARYYDPYLGRFISADTIVPNPANPIDFNRYAYAAGNPLRFTDPSGHCIPGYNCPGDRGGTSTPTPTSTPTSTPTATPTSTPTLTPTPTSTPTPMPVSWVHPRGSLNSFHQQQIGNACGPTSLAMNMNIKLAKMGISERIDAAEFADALQGASQGLGTSGYRITWPPSIRGATLPSGMVMAFNDSNTEWVNAGGPSLGTIESAQGGRQDLINNMNNGYPTSALWTYDESIDGISGGHWVSVVGYDPNKNEVQILNPASGSGRVEQVDWAAFDRLWSNNFYGLGGNHYVTIK
jgi:RHS repeat-associated protein